MLNQKPTLVKNQKQIFAPFFWLNVINPDGYWYRERLKAFNNIALTFTVRGYLGEIYLSACKAETSL
ncbi:MAG: hypothetical protein ABFS16_16825 [Bacteroidota bacterium]